LTEYGTREGGGVGGGGALEEGGGGECSMSSIGSRLGSWGSCHHSSCMVWLAEWRTRPGIEDEGAGALGGEEQGQGGQDAALACKGFITSVTI